jgi:predicted lipid-binding transport protein (Tim44 family)
MRKCASLVSCGIVSLILALVSVSDANAKRLGGGSSFGGKSSYSTPFKRSTSAPAPSARQKQASQQNQAAKQGLAQRGGLMGMLGGLAIGGLLGALLFGGAFENLNLMDFLIFGGIAFMLYKLLGARSRATPQPAYNGTPHTRLESSAPASRDGSSGSDSKHWFRGEAAGAGNDDQPTTVHAIKLAAIPEGFDAEAFMVGARIAHRELQKAWDSRDLAAIRGLTTDTMFGELQDRITALDANNRTDVLKLEAELLEAREVGDALEAVVLFDAIMREDANTQASQVREVWHFTKPIAAQQPKWFLDGIQQLED